MSTPLALSISAFLILINAFFVGVELSFVASRRTKLRALADDGAAGASVALAATSNITRQFFAAQLGITVASLLLGLIAERAVSHLVESAIEGVVELSDSVLRGIGFTVALVLVVFVHTVFGEMVPKNIAIARPETAARFLAPIHRFFVAAVRPIIWILAWLSRPLLRLAGVDSNSDMAKAHTPQELVRMLDASRTGGLVEENEHALLTGALDWGDIRVRAAMIPFAQIVSIPRTATVREIEQVVVDSGHSRLPVLGGSGREMIGFVHAKDLLRLPHEAHDEPPPLEVIRRMLTVGVDRKLEDLLLSMKGQRTHMALVTAGDEVVGMVTLEDILEELVGEIYDESD